MGVRVVVEGRGHRGAGRGRRVRHAERVAQTVALGAAPTRQGALYARGAVGVVLGEDHPAVPATAARTRTFGDDLTDVDPAAVRRAEAEPAQQLLLHVEHGPPVAVTAVGRVLV